MPLRNCRVLEIDSRQLTRISVSSPTEAGDVRSGHSSERPLVPLIELVETAIDQREPFCRPGHPASGLQ
jgi:hypothetical protein